MRQKPEFSPKKRPSRQLITLVVAAAFPLFGCSDDPADSKDKAGAGTDAQADAGALLDGGGGLDAGSSSGSSSGGSSSGGSSGGVSASGKLTVSVAEKGNGIKGSFTFLSAKRNVAISLQASVDTTKKAASAKFSDSVSKAEILVQMPSNSSVEILVQGNKIDGKGALTDKESAAIKALAGSDVGLGIAMAALEAGCLIPSDKGVDIELAALLAPLQLMMKYAPSFPSTELLLKDVSCDYLDNQDTSLEVPATLPGGDEDGPKVAPKKLVSRAILVQDVGDVPYVHGIWPFDDKGAATKTADLGHDTRPCGAKCPGTCGPDCPTNNCTTWFRGVCEKNGAGANTGRFRVQKKWNCGSHKGCRDHDGCYDGCNATYGCGSWGAASCRRGCDILCINEYCHECAWAGPVICLGLSLCECSQWMNGHGPYDRTDVFSHWVTNWTTNLARCPKPVVDAGSTDDATNDAGTDVSGPDAGGGGTDIEADVTTLPGPDVLQEADVSGLDAGSTVDSGSAVDAGGAVDAGTTDAGTTDAAATDTATTDTAPTDAGCKFDSHCVDGNVCTLDKCIKATGVCDNQPESGGKCSDGTLCTVNDTCKNGQCAPGTPINCDDNDKCTTDGCNVTSGICFHTPISGCKSCTNNVQCNDGNGCTTDSCNKTTGDCVHAKLNGASCDDKNKCTVGDACVTGDCKPGPVKNCDDANPCTTDACDPGSGGCSHTAVIDGTACGGGICTAGVCNTPDAGSSGPDAGSTTPDTSIPMPDTSIPMPDTSISTPDAGTPPMPDTSISIPDAGTPPMPDTSIPMPDTSIPMPDTSIPLPDAAIPTPDAGAPGGCQFNSHCVDGNVCTDDTCNKTTGICENKPTAGGSCSDGSLCTKNDKCVAGVCDSGTPITCDDNNLCTLDVCNPSSGICSYTPLADGAPCPIGLCVSGQCKPPSMDAGPSEPPAPDTSSTPPDAVP